MAGINDLVRSAQTSLVASIETGITDREASQVSHTTRRTERQRVMALAPFNANHVMGGVDVFSPDAVRPTVTVNKKVGQADPATASPVLFTIVFSEPVTGLVSGDIDITGTATTGTKTLTGSGTTYELSVVVTTDGTVIADIAADKAQDANGNLNVASTSTDNNVSVDLP